MTTYYCDYEGCDKPILSEECLWGPYAFCEEHEKQMNEELEKYMKEGE